MRTAHSLQLRTLKGLPTIRQGACCNLKLETANGERWWVCRMPPTKTNHRIVVETYNDTTNTWEKTQVFTDQEA